MNLKRLFVLKKNEFQTDGKLLLKEFENFLKIKNLENVKVVYRYDIINVKEEIYNKAEKMIFSDYKTDELYLDNLPLDIGETVLGFEYLKGQYDERVEFIKQAFKLLGVENAEIYVAKFLILTGDISEIDLNHIKTFNINPVDAKEVFYKKEEALSEYYKSETKDTSLILQIKIPVEHVKRAELRSKLGYTMSLDDFCFASDYFKNIEKRNPTETELKMIDTYWSDHCRHTTFFTKIENVEFEEGKYSKLFENTYKNYLDNRKIIYKDKDRDITLMDLATIGAKVLKNKGLLNDLEESEEVNACSIEIVVDVDGNDETWLLMFKNETHNHPTEIEPLGGASTCLGGGIRDPLSGRAYVYQAMRITGCGNPLTPYNETLEGKLPQRVITKTALKGYSSYGNQIGLASGFAKEIYHHGYTAKRMELGALVGAVKKENVIRETPKKGDLILLVGGKTGRDGCGGATGSSKEQTYETLTKASAEVQKGNAPLERYIHTLFNKPEVSKMIKKSNDFGAGGVSVAVGELADGLYIELDKVPLKYEGLTGTEVAISESQERMAVVISPENEKKFIELSKLENLEATTIATVTDDRRIKMLWQGNLIVDISRDFLDTNGVTQTTDILVKNIDDFDYFNDTIIKKEMIKDTWLKNNFDLNKNIQKGLIDRFDSTIGTNTVLMPLGGINQLTPIEAMVARIPVKSGKTKTASIMSYGYNPVLSEKSQYHGAYYSVIESISRLVASGGDYKKIRLSFQEFFERLGNDSSKWGKPFASLLGALEVEFNLNLPAIGGKDSMSGTFLDIDVPPTLVSFAVASEKIDNILSPEFKEVGNKVVLIKNDIKEDGTLDLEKFSKTCSAIYELNKQGKIKSCISLKDGGLAEALSTMVLGNDIGFKFSDESQPLFKPMYGSFLLEVSESLENLHNSINNRDLEILILGQVVSEKSIILSGLDLKITNDEILLSLTENSKDLFPYEFHNDDKISNLACNQNLKPKSSNIKISKPKVVIPVLWGANGEVDGKRAFENAGADVFEKIFLSDTNIDFENSIKDLSKEIENSNILYLPSSFNGDDEPVDIGRLYTLLLENDRIKEVVMKFLNNDGLILSIGNSVKALISTGLLEFGEYSNVDSKIKLCKNPMGRHISSIINFVKCSNLSPWLDLAEYKMIYKLPMSIQDGKFNLSTELVEELSQKGQIASQYVNNESIATYDYRYNPLNSYYGIESITSPDGRILGKISNPERFDLDLYKNIPNKHDSLIFKSGVKYFS